MYNNLEEHCFKTAKEPAFLISLRKRLLELNSIKLTFKKQSKDYMVLFNVQVNELETLRISDWIILKEYYGTITYMADDLQIDENVIINVLIKAGLEFRKLSDRDFLSQRLYEEFIHQRLEGDYLDVSIKTYYRTKEFNLNENIDEVIKEIATNNFTSMRAVCSKLRIKDSILNASNYKPLFKCLRKNYGGELQQLECYIEHFFDKCWRWPVVKEICCALYKSKTYQKRNPGQYSFCALPIIDVPITNEQKEDSLSESFLEQLAKELNSEDQEENVFAESSYLISTSSYTLYGLPCLKRPITNTTIDAADDVHQDKRYKP